MTYLGNLGTVADRHGWERRHQHAPRVTVFKRRNLTITVQADSTGTYVDRAVLVKGANAGFSAPASEDPQDTVADWLRRKW